MHYFTFLVIFLFGTHAIGQFTTPITDVVSTEGNSLENVHVENLISHEATITDSNGVFAIEVNLGDALHFTHIATREQFYPVIQETLESSVLMITLFEELNVLEDITLQSSSFITAQSLGIIERERVIPTASERRLLTAGDFKTKHLLQGLLVGAIPLDPILNAINSRTKQIKKYKAIDKQITDFDNLYVDHAGYLAMHFSLNDEEVIRFLGSLMRHSETEQMAQQKGIGKGRIWLLDKYLAYEKSRE